MLDMFAHHPELLMKWGQTKLQKLKFAFSLRSSLLAILLQKVVIQG